MSIYSVGMLTVHKQNQLRFKLHADILASEVKLCKSSGGIVSSDWQEQDLAGPKLEPFD